MPKPEPIAADVLNPLNIKEELRCFSAVAHAVWIAVILIVESIRTPLYEYQDFKAMLRRRLDALHLGFELHQASSEEIPVLIRQEFSWSELTKREKETMDAVRLAGLQGIRESCRAGGRRSWREKR